MGRIAITYYLALAAIACSESGAARPDGSSDGGKLDVGTTLRLEISVSGCAAYDAAGTCNPGAAAAPCCTGHPPLALSFAPLGSQELTRFQWDFGDGTATSDERAPMHTYAHPGRYQVTLTGGGSNSGSINPREPLTVIVEPLAAGLPCEVDAQCGDGLGCLCTPGGDCASPPARRICTADCAGSPCSSGAVCAALPGSFCLASCQTDAQCAAGFVCMTLRAGFGTPGPWTRGCLPVGVRRDVGGSCRDANGALASELCTTASCSDIGALGVCTASCDAGFPCPEGTACSLLASGPQLCLPTCTVKEDCAQDPLLACDVARPPTGMDRVCRPRSCGSDAVCAPSGRCGRDGVCVPR